MRLAALLLALVALAGCATGPLPAPGPTVGAPAAPGAPAARSFAAVVAQVAPVAEQECRQRTSGVPCNFRVFVDTRPDAPPNAFQTEDRRGRPVIVFTDALIADARNPDELAFVLGHEAAHHILGHLPRTRAKAELGARVFAGVAEAAGQSPDFVTEAARLGAAVGARRFSQQFELEADELGTVIAAQAGFDPRTGALFFARIPDPGDRFLGTHPPNAARAAVVAATADRLGLP